MPCREGTSCWRYRGRCSENLLTRTNASSPGAANPALDGMGHRLGRGHAVLAAGTRILGIDVVQDHELAGDVVELLGHVLADLGLLAAAGADPLVGGDVVPDFLPGQVVRDPPAAVPLATTMCGRPPSRLWIGGFLGDRRRRIGIEEVLLVGCLRQPLPPRPEEQPLQGQIVFLQAGIRTLELLGGRDELVELVLEVAESLQRGTEPVLAGRQIIRDGIDGLGHTLIDVSNRA